jgi:hypothetical protein
VAQGGADRTVLARRYDTWYDRPEVIPGAETPDANANAMVVLRAVASGGYAVIDANGIGASTYFLAQAHARDRVRAFTGSDRSDGRDKSGALSFVNLRAAAYWAFREALDPSSGQDVALPPDRELRVELCAARWQVQAGGVRIEAKEDIVKRLGRSPDLADAVVMAWWDDPRAERMQQIGEAFSAAAKSPATREVVVTGAGVRMRRETERTGNRLRGHGGDW